MIYCSSLFQYTYLVNTQMESQRNYFEDKIVRIEKEALHQISDLELKSKQMSEARVEAEKKANVLSREKQAAEKKITQVTPLVYTESIEITQIVNFYAFPCTFS